jgi:NADPH-dependent glutamate synthase beta subunit-like oxidoreductase
MALARAYRLLLWILALIVIVQASEHEQCPFAVGEEEKVNRSSPLLSSSSSYQRPKKVAIIGAGPGGTSTAYFLSKANEKLASLGKGDEGFEITVFERDERIGGRTAVVHPYYNEDLPAIELGASIFADVNKNLKRLAEVRGAVGAVKYCSRC